MNGKKIFRIILILAVIGAVSRKQSTPDEERGRAVAVALAAKVVSKL